MKFDDTQLNYDALDAADRPITPGDYQGVIMDDTDLCETKAGGAGIKVKVRLQRAPDGSDVNRQLTDTVGYSAAAAFKIKDLADGAGVARPTEISESAARAFVAALRGQEITVRVAANSYVKDGTTVNNSKIAKYVAAPKVAPVVAVGGRRR